MSAIGRVRMQLARRRRIPLHESSRQALLRVRIHNRQAPSVGDRCRTLSRLKKRSAAALATQLPGTDRLLDSTLQLVLAQKRSWLACKLSLTVSHDLHKCPHSPRRSDTPEGVRAPARGTPPGERPRRGPAGLPPGGLAAPQGSERRRPGEERSEGVRRIYSLRREGLMELRDWLDTFWDDALAAFKEEVEKT